MDHGFNTDISGDNLVCCLDSIYDSQLVYFWRGDKT